MAGVTSQLAGALADLFAPLTTAFDHPTYLGALLGELGYAVGDLTAQLPVFDEVMAIAEPLAALADAAAQLEAEPDAGAVANAMIETGAALFDAIHALRELSVADLRGLTAPFDDPATWTELAERLPVYLLVAWLEGAHPMVAGVLRVAGVLGPKPGPRTAPAAIDWSALGELVTDPIGQIKRASGFGGDFRHGPLLDAIAEIGRGAGYTPALQPMRATLVDRWYAGYAGWDPRELAVRLWSGFVLDGSLYTRLGVLLAPVPSSDRAAAPDALLVTAAVEGDLAASMALDDTWVARVVGTIDATGSLGALITPRGVVPVTAAATYDLGLELVASPASPWLLLGAAAATRFESTGVLFGLYLRGTTAAPELVVALEPTAGTRLVISLADADSFLGELLGAGELAIDLAPALRWSSLSGFAFGGAVGFDVTIPIGLALGPLEIDSVHVVVAAGSDGLELRATVSLAAALGPFAFVVEDVGLRFDVASRDGGDARGNFGAVGVELGFKPPAGLGLAIDLGELGGGGGYLACYPEEGRYAGVADVDLLGVGITAIGVLTTGAAGVWSLFLSLSATFTGLQLGFGFTLNGVGGLIGINRGVDLEALSDGVRSGALEGLLFPDDPIADATRILADLDAIFPPAAGQYVVGPIAKIGWGTPTLATVDLGVVIQLPDPLTISLLGSFEAILPTADAPVLELRVDVAGTLDVTHGTLAIDASLRDSKVAGLALSGDMAMRAAFFDAPSFLMAFGGFNPRFVPPAGFPALKRLAVALDGGDALRLELAGYFAITSNTIQFGSSCDLWARAIGLTVEGDFTFDALLQLSPFWFVVDLGFGVTVRAGNTELLSVHLDFMLEGPTPWHALGTAAVKILGVKKSFHVEVTIGGGGSSTVREAIDVRGLVLDALRADDAWREVPPDASAQGVALGNDGVATELRVHPGGVLEVRQRVAPLERDLERYGGATVTGLGRFALEDAMLGGAAAVVEAVDDWFASAQYFELSDADKLSAPSFEEMPCGLRLGDAGSAGGPAAEFPLGYEQIVRDPDVNANDAVLLDVHAPDDVALAAAVARSPVARVRGARGFAIGAAGVPAFGLSEVRYVVADAETGAAATTAASWSQARSASTTSRASAPMVVPSYEQPEAA